MDKMIQFPIELEKQVVDLANSIGKIINGHTGGVCALALCECLARVMHQSKIPLDLVVETIVGNLKLEESDETAH
jgi:hypothetical protein